MGSDDMDIVNESITHGEQPQREESIQEASLSWHIKNIN
jgi:hypothetical protein